MNKLKIAYVLSKINKFKKINVGELIKDVK